MFHVLVCTIRIIVIIWQLAVLAKFETFTDPVLDIDIVHAV